MLNFRKVIREINRTLGLLLFFEVILNSIIFFLVVYLMLSLLNLYPNLAFIPTALFFLIKLYLNSRIDKKRMVEKEYKPLEEKLRTAADNMNESNPVIDELQEEVVHELKNVGISSFFNMRSVTMRIFLTMVLAFAIVFSTTLNLYVVDVTKLFNDAVDAVSGQGKRIIDTPIGELNQTNDIYGKSSLAMLGNQNLNIQIKPVNYEVSVRDSGDVEQKQFQEMFPKDAFVEQASAYEEKIPEEQQELVKSYFNELSKN